MRKFFLLAVLSILAISPHAVAQPTPLPSFTGLAHKSPVIVKGCVIDVHQLRAKASGATTLRKLSATVKISRRIKGTLQSDQITINDLTSQSSSSIPPNNYKLSKDECGLFFLAHRANGTYFFAVPYWGKLVVSCRSAPSDPSTRTTVAKLEMELFASLSDPDPAIAKSALLLARIMIDPGKTQLTADLHRLAASKSPETRGMAYSALIHLGDLSLLRQSIRFAETKSPNPPLQYWKYRVAAAIKGKAPHPHAR